MWVESCGHCFVQCGEKSGFVEVNSKNPKKGKQGKICAFASHFPWFLVKGLGLNRRRKKDRVD